jgi:hypothetical protein
MYLKLRFRNHKNLMQARSMSTKGPHVPDGDVLGDITLAY